MGKKKELPEAQEIFPLLLQEPLPVPRLPEVPEQVPGQTLQEVPPLSSEVQIPQQVLVSWEILLQKILFQKQIPFQRPKILWIWKNNLSRGLQELEKQVTDKVSE